MRATGRSMTSSPPATAPRAPAMRSCWGCCCPSSIGSRSNTRGSRPPTSCPGLPRPGSRPMRWRRSPRRPRAPSPGASWSCPSAKRLSVPRSNRPIPSCGRSRARCGHGPARARCPSPDATTRWTRMFSPRRPPCRPSRAPRSSSAPNTTSSSGRSNCASWKRNCPRCACPLTAPKSRHPDARAPRRAGSAHCWRPGASHRPTRPCASKARTGTIPKRASR